MTCAHFCGNQDVESRFSHVYRSLACKPGQIEVLARLTPLIKGARVTEFTRMPVCLLQPFWVEQHFGATPCERLRFCLLSLATSACFLPGLGRDPPVGEFLSGDLPVCLTLLVIYAVWLAVCEFSMCMLDAYEIDRLHSASNTRAPPYT